VPEIWSEAQKSVISMNPNWNYKLLTDDDNLVIVRENFPDFYQTFISFKYPIQRADAIRYCVLYLYGGIYLDLDYICNKPFDSIILNKEVGLIMSNNTPGIFTNSFLMSKPRSEFWLLCIAEMQKKLPWYKKITKHFEIMNSTGPLMVNGVARKNKNYIEELTFIQTPCNVCNINKCKSNLEFYITPIPGSSWHSWDSALLNNILCNKEFYIIFILLLISILIIKKNNVKH